MNAARLIRMARLQAGLSLRDLGARAGTSHSTLSAYESGRKVPATATLDRIVSAAGFALDATMARRIDRHGSLPRGEELAAVLDLAEAFPARHALKLECPVFGR